MLTLKDLTSLVRSNTVLLIDNRSKIGGVVETTAGAAWFELLTTGARLRVDYITPENSRLLVTVSKVDA